MPSEKPPMRVRHSDTPLRPVRYVAKAGASDHVKGQIQDAVRYGGEKARNPYGQDSWRGIKTGG
jgi:hypothetical protein